jgi:pimeloyl-ACP methyl ester carboxylesterase
MSTPAPITGFRSAFAIVGGVRLHYWIGGVPDGQPVILWHGFLSTAYAWRYVGPALADAGHSVLIPDMRGYGDSDKPAMTPDRSPGNAEPSSRQSDSASANR